MFPQNINGFASQIKSEMNFQNNSKINIFMAGSQRIAEPNKIQGIMKELA